MQILLLAIFNILLYKYTGQEDIVVGTATAGRQHADLENLIGMFVNMLALRNYPKGDKTYREFLQEVKEFSLEAYQNQDYQFEMLLDSIKVVREPGRNPIYDVMFTVQNLDTPVIELEEIKFRSYDTGHTTSHADLNLMALIGESKIFFSLEYLTRLFKRETIERMGEHFKKIVKVVTDNSDIRLSEIDIISETEKQEILSMLNGTSGYISDGKKQRISQVEFDF